MKCKLSLVFGILALILSVGSVYITTKIIKLNPIDMNRNKYEIALGFVSEELAYKDKLNEEKGTLVTIYFQRSGGFSYKLDTIAPPQDWKLCVVNKKDSIIEIIGEWLEAPRYWNGYWEDE